MRNKIIAVMGVAVMLAGCAVGCAKEETVETKEICSGCEQEKVCGTYTVDGVDYIVCDDCYEEFATGMGLN